MPKSFNGALKTLAADLPRLSAGTAHARMSVLRRMALAEGLVPAAEVVDSFAAAFAADQAGTPVGCWMEAIGTAAACGQGDAGTARLVMATVGARLAG